MQEGGKVSRQKMDGNQGTKRKFDCEVSTLKRHKVIVKKPTLSEELAFIAQSLEANFHSTMAAYPFDQKDVEQVVLGHMKPREWCHLHSKALLRLMDCWVPITLGCAKKNPYFASLKSDDGTLLMSNNVNLFKEYCLARYITATSGIEQLSWIIGLDIQNSIDQQKWGSVGKINFAAFNTKDGLIIKDQALVKNYLESVHGLTYLFNHFKSDMNPLLANIIMFSTDTWGQTDLQEVKELNRIQNIQDFCIKAFDFKYGFKEWSYLSEGFFMTHLLRSLRYFETKNGSPSYLPLRLKVIESDSLTREEMTWVKNLKMKYFHDICQVVRCDTCTIQLAIAVQAGQLEFRHKMMYSYFCLLKERFQRLIEEGLELNIQGINPMLYDLCSTITGARSEHLATFEQKLHFLTQSPHLHHFPKVHEMSTKKSYLTAYKSETTSELMQKQLMAEKKIASFVMNLDIYLLVILDTLLKYPINR